MGSLGQMIQMRWLTMLIKALSAPLPDLDMEEDSEILAAKDSFGHSIAFSGSVSATEEGPRHDAIPSTWQATAFGERTIRYRCFMTHDIIHDIICDIRYDILLCTGLCGVTGTLPQQS